MKKCHILEGTNAGGTTAYTACGRSLKRNEAEYVGRAWILKGTWVGSVTCTQCRKAYVLGAVPPSTEKP
jgi:hypothetical protein